MEASFLITGIHCASCINKMDTKLKSIGVNHFDFNFKNKVATIDFDIEKTNTDEIRETIEALGYHAYLKGNY